MKKIVLILLAILTIIVTTTYAAIQGDFVINVVDPSSGIKFYRVPGSVVNGMRVDVTRVSAGTKTPADAFANPTDAITTWGLNAGYNGATWDMLRSGGNNSDAVATATLGYLRTINYLYGWNAATWDRVNVGTTASDAITPSTTGNISTRAFNMFYNGSTWSRNKGKSYEHLVQAGEISGAWAVNKFGAAPDGIQTSLTDIWDRADATPTQQIWLAPTAARVHSIVSTTTDDDGSPAGIGARTVTVYGLTAWSDTVETSETVTLDGITPVNTSNSYVIIHRMKTATTGTGGPNVGTITATAAVDSTITAVILPQNGNTEMAIYGVPTKTAYIRQWCTNLDKAIGVAVAVDYELRINETPASQTTAFHRKDDISLVSTGTTQFCKQYSPPYKVTGPAIIKIQAQSTTADTDAEAGFDLIIE